MAEYINKEAVRDALYEADAILMSGLKILNQFPAADVAPVRHGRWIKRGYACGDNEYECSVCHETEWRTSAIRLKYCPNCGCKMLEDSDGKK